MMDIQSISLQKLVNQPCCRKEMIMHSDIEVFSLGFGQKISNNLSSMRYYGEWEIGAYDMPWRVLKSNTIILSSSFNYGFHQDILRDIQLGSFLGFAPLHDGVISMLLGNDIRIDFFCTHESEVFHIFLPEKNYIQFAHIGGWQYGKSDMP